MTDGSSYIEAVENAEIVINEWIEMAKELGIPVPEPKGKLRFACRQRQVFLTKSKKERSLS